MAAQTIDVLIVTAADGEDDAVRAVTEGARGPWKRLDSQEYRLAVWHCEFDTPRGRPLRVALTRAVSIGTDAAAHALGALAQQLRPRCVAMCGVCAGRPGWVELGDVIVADRVYRYDVGEIVNESA